MKNLIKYIHEKLILNKLSKSKSIDTNFTNFIKDIDPTEFKWDPAYSVDDYQMKCKNETRKFANEVYSNLKSGDRIIQLYKDTAKKYYSSYKLLNDINDVYNYDINIIDKYGWAHFESMSLEQGWWAFMYWLIKKY